MACALPATAEPADDLPPEAPSGRPQRGPQPPPVRPMNLYSLLGAEDLRAELERRHLGSSPLPVLLERVTRGLVAAPYLLSPLGEGEGLDPDPRFRLDAFDCTTFVETAIALVRCDGLPEVRAELDGLRYRQGAIGFQARHHLMTSDWIPSLVQSGVLRDVTRRIGGKSTKEVVLAMGPARWKKRRVARTLALADEALPSGRYPLPYLPVAWVLKHLEQIPPGVVLNVVRVEVPWSPDVITHQGLVIHRPGERTPLVRHASPISKRVIDEPLARMMERYARPNPWPIAGVNLLEIVDPGGTAEWQSR